MEYWLFKYLWLIAIVPKEMQMLILLLLLIGNRFRNKTDTRFDIYSFGLLAVNVIYGVSIVINTIRGQHELTRVLAAGNTCLITFVGIFFYNFYRKMPLDIGKIERYMFINSVILIGLYGFFLLVGTRGNVPFLNPLCGIDWIFGKEDIRFRGYLEYTNLVVFLYLYCYPFAFRYIRSHKNKLFLWIYEILAFIPIIGTNSRTGMVCGAGMLMISFCVANHQAIAAYFAKNKKRLLFIAIVLVVSVGILLYGKIIGALNYYLSLRANSTNTRMMIYTESIRKMLRESPLIGCGIKDMLGGFPYGSHSTYIGMYYKTGLVGGTLFLLLTAFGIIKLLKNKAWAFQDSMVMKAAILCVFALCVLEDLDGANWNIVVFYSIYAVLVRNRYAPQRCLTINTSRG